MHRLCAPTDSAASRSLYGYRKVKVTSTYVAAVRGRPPPLPAHATYLFVPGCQGGSGERSDCELTGSAVGQVRCASSFPYCFGARPTDRIFCGRCAPCPTASESIWLRPVIGNCSHQPVAGISWPNRAMGLNPLPGAHLLSA